MGILKRLNWLFFGGPIPTQGVVVNNIVRRVGSNGPPTFPRPEPRPNPPRASR